MQTVHTQNDQILPRSLTDTCTLKHAIHGIQTQDQMYKGLHHKKHIYRLVELLKY